MLAERILETLAVLEEDGSVGADGNSTHIERQEHLGARAFLDIHFISLTRERSVEVVLIRQNGASEKYGRIIEPCQRHFGAAVSGHAPWCAAVCSDNIYIVAAHAVAEECDFRAVGAPDRTGVIARVGGNTQSSSAGCRNGVDIAFVSEGDCMAVRRYGGVTQPQRSFGGKCSGSGKRCT